MQLHNLTQGTDAWHQHRASHFNASDAPAMMGCSPYKTRSQLLHELHTGLTPEVDAAQQRRFDDGHRYEALARPLAEEFIGQELYPVVGSEGRYSASSDGLTMDETIGFEHKSLNDDLRAVMVEGCTGADLPLQYRVQMEQQLIVFGSEKILFMASKWAGEDLIEERHGWYESDPELRASILAGWDQFAADLDAYVPAVVEVKAIGRTPETLPALRIELTGAVTASNLSEFKEHAMAVFAGINRNLTTDQEFADAEKAVKWAKEVEQRLSAAKEHALSQTASIDQLFKTIDDISAEARRMRLELDKLVTNRKEAIRGEIVAAGQDQFRAHIDKLNDSLGRKLMPLIPADFGGVVKGKRTVESLRDAVDTELARVKIEASDIAHRIAQNLRVLESADMDILFPDVATIVLKAPDDFQALVNSRVAEHAAKEAARTVKVDQFVPSAEVAKVLTAFSPPITSDALPITIEAYPVIDTAERQGRSAEEAVSEQAPKTQWAWWLEDDETYDIEATESACHGAAQDSIDSDTEPGIEREYFIARPAHPLDTIANDNLAHWLGNFIHEYIDLRCSEETGAEEESLPITKEDKAEMGQLVLDFLRARAKVRWWGIDKKTMVRHTYVAGSDDETVAEGWVPS